MRVFILTVGDNELVRLAKLFNFTLLVHSVGLLVVDEEVGGAGATGLAKPGTRL